MTAYSFPCPVCGDGEWTITIDSDGNEVGSPVFDCSAGSRCEAAYVNGQYGDKLAAAIREADEIEAARMK